MFCNEEDIIDDEDNEDKNWIDSLSSNPMGLIKETQEDEVKQETTRLQFNTIQTAKNTTIPSSLPQESKNEVLHSSTSFQSKPRSVKKGKKLKAKQKKPKVAQNQALENSATFSSQSLSIGDSNRFHELTDTQSHLTSEVKQDDATEKSSLVDFRAFLAFQPKYNMLYDMFQQQENRPPTYSAISSKLQNWTLVDRESMENVNWVIKELKTDCGKKLEVLNNDAINRLFQQSLHHLCDLLDHIKVTIPCIEECLSIVEQLIQSLNQIHELALKANEKYDPAPALPTSSNTAARESTNASSSLKIDRKSLKSGMVSLEMVIKEVRLWMQWDKVWKNRMNDLANNLILALLDDGAARILSEESTDVAFSTERFIWGWNGMIFGLFTPIYAPYLAMINRKNRRKESEKEKRIDSLKSQISSERIMLKNMRQKLIEVLKDVHDEDCFDEDFDATNMVIYLFFSLPLPFCFVTSFNYIGHY